LRPVGATRWDGGMARRALLIGSEIAGLTGVGNDLDIVTGLLGDRGFEIRRHEKGDATRAAIGQAFADLVADTESDDAVVVYYSGHGGRAVDTGAPLEGIPRELQFIAPYDFLESTADDFRGISALEMSVHVAELTRRTRNVSVILDCCYSSRMARDTTLVPRALPRDSYVDVAAHLTRIDAAGLARRLSGDVESNPDAVRLVAAGPTEQAFEYDRSDGTRVGLLTDALRTLLTAADAAPVTWAAVAEAARRWIAPVAPNQRPEAEGPADRFLFDTRLRDLTGVLQVAVTPAGARLAAGTLAGVGVGDVYAARLPGRPHDDLGLLTVQAVTAGSADAAVTLAAGEAKLPRGVEAHPVTRAGRRWPVAVVGTGPDADAVRAGLAASPLVVPQVAEQQRALVTVRVDAAGAAITDTEGTVVDPVPAGADGVRLLVRNVERLARAAGLGALGDSDPEIAASTSAGWARLVDGGTAELPAEGATLYEGDRICVRLRNDAPEQRWFYLFSLGVGGRVNRLTNDPSGLGLAPGAEWVVGYRPDAGVTAGLTVGWPDGVSRSGPRPASLLVLVTDRRQDLSALEQEGVVSRGGERSALRDLLAQLVDGGTRDVGGEQVAGLRWARHDLDHLLVPAPRPPAEQATFLVDDRPASTVVARSVAPAPQAVAVRLTDLWVLRNRALGSADLRLDGVVVTGPAGPGGAPVTTWGTWRFPRVGDGDRLSFGTLLLAHGAVQDYLDFGVWLSRDRSEARDLATLVDERLNDPAFTQAAGALAVAAPPVAGVVASLGAAGSLMNLGYRVLAAAVGHSIGLYRNAFLASEGFGVGEHPVTAQGMHLRYRIEAV
jgi:Caspase domain